MARPGPSQSLRSGVTIQPGTWRDYLALVLHHYRHGHPGTRVLVLAARDGESLAGVLVVSMPTLNGPWREAAWPGRYSPTGRGGKVAAARRLNAEVRTISRVIVHPRYRGLGVAGALVRAYLAAPLTPRTESLAAMGRYCPFFERAGMRPVTYPQGKRDARLARRLRALGVAPWQLIDLDAAGRLFARNVSLRRAVRAWAMRSRATRYLPAGSSLPALAGGSLTARPAAFVFDTGGASWHNAERRKRGPTPPASGTRTATRSPRSAIAPARRTSCTRGSSRTRG